jgi:3',5'-cyclic AMP phosphodiesterase CpdA
MLRPRRWLVFFPAALNWALFLPPAFSQKSASDAFLVQPYIQLGNRPALLDPEELTVVWHTADTDHHWQLEVKNGKGWRAMAAPQFDRIRIRTLLPFRIYTAELTGLAPGQRFPYRVLRDGAKVFEAEAIARKSARQPFRVAVFGDCGADTPAQRAVAFEVYQARPDLVVHPGDIVYSRGRITEYRTKYFPIYNADRPSPDTGAPLLRSVLFMATPGNHDTATSDLDRYPDAQAYFFFWRQPLQGPHWPDLARLAPPLMGSPEDVQNVRQAAGVRLPRMANFSFEYGSAHWTMIDSNRYVDWTHPELRAWLERDLAAARKIPWRFVVFHHPGFNSSKAHFNDQWMRELDEIFRKHKVQIVFAGHVHNYQRSFPLRYKQGSWEVEKSWDGTGAANPPGVIYIVTGAGGANLYNPEQQGDPASWQSFTRKFISQVHSFSLLEIDGPSLVFRQISKTGDELDRFTLRQ